MKEWKVSGVDKEQAKRLADEYGLPGFLSILLTVRNMTDPNEFRRFLSAQPQISPPDDIIDMDKAAKRILKAVDRFEKICVFGDYDADGVTATALLYSYLEAVGADVMYYIPDRETQGYGMNIPAVRYLSEQGVNLIITVDNGISAIEEIAYANTLGIDTVVTDHHTVGDVLPPAAAVVDLHRSDCPSKFKELCGVGVVFKLVMALEGEYCDVQSLLENYAELVAIGTVGDIVQLKLENRDFVRTGLQNIRQTERIGILAMLEEAGLTEKTLTAGRMSFTLVPRINAAGRLGSSGKSVQLLLTDDEEFAQETARKLGEENARRQDIEKDILSKINSLYVSRREIFNDRVVVIDGENWHQGVIGIAAARIKEIIGKPCIIITCGEEETAKASGRSVSGFSLCDAVFACRELLEHFGGHPMAVGFSIKKENIEKFRKKINEYAASLGAMPNQCIDIDCKLNPAQLNVSMVDQIRYLEPFGAGNPSPVFGLFRMRLESAAVIGAKHLKLTLKRDNALIRAMLFFTEKENFPYEAGDILDLAVALDINEFNGARSVSVIVKEMRFNGSDNLQMLREKAVFESLLRGEALSADEVSLLTPSRDDFALVYRFLRQRGGFGFSPDVLCFRLENKIPYARLEVILTAMEQLGLIKKDEDLYTYKISVLPVNGKVDIFSAPIFEQIKKGAEKCR